MLGSERLESQITSIIDESFAKLGKDALSLIPASVAHIPKILGFDFLVKQDGTLVLIEVNATPGLMPRDDKGDEYEVKKAVLEEAWGNRIT